MLVARKGSCCFANAFLKGIKGNLAEIQPKNHQNVQKMHFLQKSSRSQWVKTPEAKFPKRMLFWISFSPKAATKTCHFVTNFQPPEPGNFFRGNRLVAKVWTVHERSDTFCTRNELKYCMGLAVLSEGYTGFWLCESLPTSRWITDYCSALWTNAYYVAIYIVP